MDIPLYTATHEPRAKIPEFVHDLLQQWKASHLFANMEYEVDELRRDIALSRIAKEHGKVSCTFVHDRCIVSPGEVTTKDGRGYTVGPDFDRLMTRTDGLLSSRPGLLAFPPYVETDP